MKKNKTYFSEKVFKFYPIFYLILLGSALIFFSCATYKLERKLDSESKEFLSIVRYIITPQERKAFLNLPPSKRKQFIEEFWKKRDPDPNTEENEFQEEYLRRIEEANHLFGPNGWLQDRGRVYILLGPPERKEVYPRGRTFYGKPMEIWYYGYFPIVFIDHYWNGNYKLEALSAYQIAQINKAQMELKPKVGKERVTFDFNLRIEPKNQGEFIIQLEIPYKNIWFKQEKDKLVATLGLIIKILDAQETNVWDLRKDYHISIEEKNLSELIQKSYLIEIPVTLKEGDFILEAELENKVTSEKIQKRINFNI